MLIGTASRTIVPSNRSIMDISIDPSSLLLECQIAGYLSTIRAILYYQNNTISSYDCTLTLPIDDQTAILDFAVVTNGDRVRTEGIENLSRKEFTSDVGTLRANSRFELVISLAAPLKIENNKWVFAVPQGLLPQKKLALISVGDFLTMHEEDRTDKVGFSLRISETCPITSIESPNRQVEVLFDELKHTADVVFSPQHFKATKKRLSVHFSTEEDFEPKIQTQFDEKTGEYAGMLTFIPPLIPEAQSASGTPQGRGDFILLIDLSASMKGGRADMAKEAAIFFVKSLPSNSKFNIVSFGDYYSKMFWRSRVASTAATNRAARRISNFVADRRHTDILSPLKSVYSEKVNPSYPRSIFLLTDGEPNLGGTQNEIVECVKSHARQVRVYTFGIGDGIDKNMITNTAKAANGTAEFITRPEEITAKVVSVLKIAGLPALSNAKVKWPRKDYEQFPSLLPVCYYGDSLTVFANYGTMQPDNEIVTFKCANTAFNEVQQFAIPIKTLCLKGNSLHVLWAKQARKELLDDEIQSERSKHAEFLAGITKKYLQFSPEAIAPIPLLQPNIWPNPDKAKVVVTKTPMETGSIMSNRCAKLRLKYRFRVCYRRIRKCFRRRPVDFSKLWAAPLVDLVQRQDQDSGRWLSDNVPEIEDRCPIPKRFSRFGDEAADLWATACIMVMIEIRFADYIREWELIGEKAKRALRNAGVDLDIYFQEIRTMMLEDAVDRKQKAKQCDCKACWLKMREMNWNSCLNCLKFLVCVPCVLGIKHACANMTLSRAAPPSLPYLGGSATQDPSEMKEALIRPGDMDTMVPPDDDNGNQGWAKCCMKTGLCLTLVVCLPCIGVAKAVRCLKEKSEMKTFPVIVASTSLKEKEAKANYTPLVTSDNEKGRCFCVRFFVCFPCFGGKTQQQSNDFYPKASQEPITEESKIDDAALLSPKSDRNQRKYLNRNFCVRFFVCFPCFGGKTQQQSNDFYPKASQEPITEESKIDDAALLSPKSDRNQRKHWNCNFCVHIFVCFPCIGRKAEKQSVVLPNFYPDPSSITPIQPEAVQQMNPQVRVNDNKKCCQWIRAVNYRKICEFLACVPCVLALRQSCLNADNSKSASLSPKPDPPKHIKEPKTTLVSDPTPSDAPIKPHFQSQFQYDYSETCAQTLQFYCEGLGICFTGIFCLPCIGFSSLYQWLKHVVKRRKSRNPPLKNIMENQAKNGLWDLSNMPFLRARYPVPDDFSVFGDQADALWTTICVITILRTKYMDTPQVWEPAVHTADTHLRDAGVDVEQYTSSIEESIRREDSDSGVSAKEQFRECWECVKCCLAAILCLPLLKCFSCLKWLTTLGSRSVGPQSEAKLDIAAPPLSEIIEKQAETGLWSLSNTDFVRDRCPVPSEFDQYGDSAEDLWATVCVVIVLQIKYADEPSKWQTAASRASDILQNAGIDLYQYVDCVREKMEEDESPMVPPRRNSRLQTCCSHLKLCLIGVCNVPSVVCAKLSQCLCGKRGTNHDPKGVNIEDIVEQQSDTGAWPAQSLKCIDATCPMPQEFSKHGDEAESVWATMCILVIIKEQYMSEAELYESAIRKAQDFLTNAGIDLYQYEDVIKKDLIDTSIQPVSEEMLETHRCKACLFYLLYIVCFSYYCFAGCFHYFSKKKSRKPVSDPHPAPQIHDLPLPDLIAKQDTTGLWRFSSFTKVSETCPIPSGFPWIQGETNDIWTTMCVIVFIQIQHAQESDQWEMTVSRGVKRLQEMGLEVGQYFSHIKSHLLPNEKQPINYRWDTAVLFILPVNIIYQMTVTSVIYTEYEQRYYFYTFLALSLMGWSLLFAWWSFVMEKASDIPSFVVATALMNFHGVYMVTVHNQFADLTLASQVLLGFCQIAYCLISIPAYITFSRAKASPISNESNTYLRLCELFYSLSKLDLMLGSYLYSCFTYYVIVDWSSVAIGVCTVSSLGMLLLLASYLLGVVAVKQRHQAALVIYLLSLPVVVGVKAYFGATVLMGPGTTVDELVLIHTCLFGEG